MLANMARLSDDMAKAKNVVSGAVRDINTVLGTIGVGLSVAYFKSLIDGAIDVQAKLFDMQRATGASIDALEQMRQVAKISGTEFDSVGQAMARLSRTMSGSGQETKVTTQALNFLNIAAKDSSGNFRDVSDVMKELAVKTSAYADGAGKTALVQDILGKNAAVLIPYLHELADSTEHHTNVTDESVRAAHEFEKALGELKTASEQAWISIANGMIPTLTTLLERFNALRAAGGLWGAILGMGDMKAGTDSISVLESKLREVQATRDALGSNALKKVFNADDIALADAQIVAMTANIKILKQVQSTAISNLPPVTEPPGSKPALNYNRGDPVAAAAELKLFISAVQKLEDELGKLGEQTELEKITEHLYGTEIMDSDGRVIHITGSLEKLTRAHADQLQLEAAEIDVKKQLIEVDKASVEFAKAYTAEQEKQDAVIAGMNTAQSQNLQNLQFETDLLKLEAPLAAGGLLLKADEIRLISQANLQRDTANALRQVDLDLEQKLLALGPQTNAGYEEAAQKLRDLAAAQKAALPDLLAAREAARLTADLTKNSVSEFNTMWSTVEQTGKTTFEFLMGAGNSTFKAIGQTIKTAIIDLLYQLTVRKWIISVGVDVAGAAGISTAGTALASAGSAASSAGGIGNLFSSASNLNSLVGLGGYSAGVSGAAIAESTFSGAAMTMGETAGAAMASTFGATIATAIPYVGAALAIYSLLGGKFGGSGTYATGTGYSLSGSATPGAGFSGTMFSNATNAGTNYADVTPQQGQVFYKAMFDKQLGLVYSDMGKLATALGTNVSALAGRSFSVNASGGPANDAGGVAMVTNAIAQVTEQMVTALIPNIKDYALANETLDVTVARIIGDLNSVKIVFEMLGSTAKVTADTAEQLVKAFGNAASLQSAFQAYYNAFYTQAEKDALATRQLAEAFTALGVAQPATREQFRALVESLDLTTASGQAMFKGLMDIAPAFDQVAKAAEAAGTAVLSIADQITAAQKDSITAIDAEISASRSAASNATNAANSYRQIAVSLADAVTKIQGGGRGMAGGTLDAIFGTAITGNAGALAALPQAANDFVSASQASARTSTEFARDQAKAIAMLTQAGAVSTGMANWQDNQAALLRAQVGALEAIKAQLALPSPDVGILTQQTGLLSTIAGLLQAQTVQIVTGNAGQALLMQDQTGQIVLANSLTTDQTGQIVLANSLTTDQTGQIVLGNSWLGQQVGILAGGINIRSADIFQTYLSEVSAAVAGNNTTEAAGVRAAIAILRQTTADGLITAAEAVPTRDALATLQAATGGLLARSIDVDTAAALQAVERATAIVQATQGLNAGQNVIQTLLNGQTVEITGGNLILRDQTGQIVASNALLRDQAGALTVGNALVGTQTQQIVTGNAIQDAVRNITAVDTSYSRATLQALIIGATTQSDSLLGILNSSASTVSLLQQLVALMGQSKSAAADQAAADQAAAAIRAAQASAAAAAAAAAAQSTSSGASSLVNTAAMLFTATRWTQTQQELIDRLSQPDAQAFLAAEGGLNLSPNDQFELIKKVAGYATGLPYVPYDDYLLRAHQGEAVLNKSQADSWRSGGDNSELVAEIRSLRAEIASMRKDTRKSAETLEAVSYGQRSFSTVAG